MAKFSEGFLQGLRGGGRRGSTTDPMLQRQAGPQYGSSDPLAKSIGGMFGMQMDTGQELAAKEMSAIDQEAPDALMQSLAVSVKYARTPQEKMAALAKLTELKQTAGLRNQKELARKTLIEQADKVGATAIADSARMGAPLESLFADLQKFRTETGDGLRRNISDEKAATLADDFTPTSIDNYINKKGPLIKLTPEEKGELTEFQQTLKDSDITKGTQEYIQLNKARAARLANGPLNRIAPEALFFDLKKDVIALPVYQDAQKLEFSSNKVFEALELAEKPYKAGDAVNTEIVRQLERSVSELYNGDSKAATEIDRFLQGKGIKRKFGDYMTGFLTGGVTEDTLKNFREIAELTNNFAIKEKENIATSYFEGLSSSLPEETKKMLNANLKANLLINPTADIVDFNNYPK